MEVALQYRLYDVALSLGETHIYMKMTDKRNGNIYDTNVDAAQLGLQYDLATTFQLMRDSFEQQLVEIIFNHHALQVSFHVFHKSKTSSYVHFHVTLPYNNALWKFIDDRFEQMQTTLLQQNSEIKRSMELLLETAAHQMMQMQTKLAAVEDIVRTLKKPDISLPTEFFLYNEYIVVTLFKPEDKSIYIKMTDQMHRYELTFDPTTQHWVRVNSDPESIYKLITETFAKKNENLSLRMSAKKDAIELSFYAVLGYFSDVHIEFDLQLPRIV